MSEETLTEAEREGLRAATGHVSSACLDWPCVTCGQTVAVVERIVTDRIASLTADLAAARAELDAARAQVAAVEAVCVDADQRRGSVNNGDLVTPQVRAALDQPGQAVARIKADALRSAVSDLREIAAAQFDAHGPRDQRGAAIWGSASWLRDRADAIEREAGQ